MNLKSFKPGTNFWIIISTIAILGFAYFFYVNYYIKGKEDNIISTRFRVLDQMGDNIDKKLAGYIGNVENQIQFMPNYYFRGEKERKLYNFNTRGDFNKDLEVVDFFETSSKADTLFKQSMQDVLKNYYPISQIKEIYGKNYEFIIKAEYQNLLTALLRNDVFDDFIFVLDSNIIYNTLGQDMILTTSQSLDNIIRGIDTDKDDTRGDLFSFTSSAPQNTAAIFSGKAFDIEISNKDYKAFLKPVEVNNDTWYIVGLMNKSRYDALSKSIAPWIIILLSMLLVLIILSLPVIKLGVLSKTEQLDTGTIINFAMSILLGGALTVLFVYFLSQTASRKKDSDIKLEALSDTVYSSFNNEINSIYRQLKNFDASYFEIDFNPNDQENKYHNRVRKNILNDSTNNFYPKEYEYGDYYFWVDTAGWQEAYLTPFNKFGSLSNLRSRDYVNKKDEWFLPDSSNAKFRIESIVSVSSGAVKGAFSIPGDSCKMPVVAVSTKFYSIIDPILPKDYSFCLIDKSGKVWFHSNKNLNLKENFIHECDDNKYLSAALYRDLTKALNVEYYNKSHRIFIRPVDDLPLYLVTMYNKSAETSFQAQVVTLSLILMGVLYLMLFLQLIGLLIIERHFQWSLSKNIIMNLTRPLMHLNDVYAYIFSVDIIIFIVIIPGMIYLQGLNAILSIFSMVIILFSYKYWVMNNNKMKKYARFWFTGFNLFMLSLINLSLIFLSKEFKYWEVFIFQAGLILILFICNIFLKNKFAGQQKRYIINYVNALFSMLVIFGIIPTLKFYEMAYNTELDIQARHSQIDLMEQREERNADINLYYAKFSEPELVENTISKRKDLGVYTEFYNRTLFTEVEDTLTKFSAPQNNRWDTLVCFFRPFYDQTVQENKYLIFNKQPNTNMYWTPNIEHYMYWIPFKEHLEFGYTSFTEDYENKTISKRRIESRISPLLFYIPYHWNEYSPKKVILYNTLFWILVLGLLYTFYKLVNYGVRQVYCLDIVENYSNQAFIERINTNLSAKNKLLITRLSSIDETDYLFKDLDSREDSFSLDWSNIDVIKDSEKLIQAELNTFQKGELEKQKSDSSYKPKPLIVVANHFDWGYDNYTTMKLKIDVVKKFIENSNMLMVLLSQLNEKKLSDHFKVPEEQENGETTSEKKLAKLKYNFSSIIGKLVIIEQPVNYSHSHEDEKRFCLTKVEKPKPGKLIVDELNATDYLKQLNSAMQTYYNEYCRTSENKKPEENIIRRINLLAERYYRDLLDSCTVEEKYVLYDTADDLIVNPKNETAIISLLEKGLLIKKCEKINFMNISFRRFVLKSLTKTETEGIEMSMGKQSGSWKGYRITFTIIIVALFAFIAIANQDFVDNLNQLFVALGGGIAVITSILGLLSKRSSGSSD